MKIAVNTLAFLLALGCSNGMLPPPVGDSGAPPGDDAGVPDPFDAGPSPLDAGPGPTDAGTVPPPVGNAIDDIDDLSLVILIGDSAAAGYNADGRNGTGGHGFARLMVDNHPAYPAYMGHDLRALWPSLVFERLAESGATSADSLSTLRRALSGRLPGSVSGDVLVLINVGGNDFNDDFTTIIDPTATAAASAELRANLAEMFRLLRERYEDPAAGKRVVFFVDDLYDPTDGTGRIPASFTDGFCSALQRPLPDSIRMQAITNLATLNAGTAEEVAELGGWLIPIHDEYLGHGMNAGAERWLDGDCAHPMNVGHHAIRRAMWEALTGDRLD